MPYKDPEKQKAAQKKWDQEHRQGKRHKVWMGIFYEDSCPNWRDHFAELTFPVCVSPLHDRDVWTKADEEKAPAHKAGSAKEPHRHWLAEYPVQQSYEEVAQDFEFLGTVIRLRWVKSLGAMARYLTHNGTPDKAQYSADGVLEYGSASWTDWCAQVEDINAQMKEMREFIRENNVTEPADFQDWCDANNPVWSRLMDMKCQNAIYRYIDRNRARLLAEFRGTSLRGIFCVSPAGGNRTPNPEP
ncbi:MAG: hypothetical protein H9W83_00340 [Leuconostoc sp.]|nr:hypothetical protein [Leuconostoc sp.]